MIVDVLDSTVELDESVLDASPDLIRTQVREYARGERKEFDVSVAFPDNLTGEVMAAMTDIPYGETRTYGALAADLGTSAIAIGGACGRNPVPLIVPCHRVVGSDGSLKGYSAADGVATKRRLLDLEARERTTGSVQTRLNVD